MRRLIGLAACLLIASSAFVWWQVAAPVNPPASVEVEIPKGASSMVIGRMLAGQGVVDSALLFRVMARLTGKAERLQSGFYRFSEPASVLEVLRRLHRGAVMAFKVTLPEGLRTDEILALLARETQTDMTDWQKALANMLDGREAEGVLLPETYSYHKPVQPAKLLAEMLEAQQQLIDNVKPADMDVATLRSMASIIEKETSLDEERPLVAAVIRNRLEQGMRLQMDPTVIYGLWREDGSFSGNLRRVDLARDTPWNTYTRTGLPPTPIGNPGRASLLAAAQPADVDYLYFVANGEGGHVFASDFDQHRQNVRRWLRIERHAGGKRDG
ncbi:MAG: endolytic transglycosylase MltG [Mariprofundaceae bacterium]